VTDRIVDVRVRILRAPLEQPILMSFGALGSRRMALVEVESDRGLVGYGESWINYPPWAAHERLATIRDGIAPLLVGRELAGVRSLVDAVATELAPFGTQWGARGPISQALSGVEIALTDLFGKLHDLSVSDLLGGAVRGEVPVYASGLSPGTAEQLARACRADSFRAVKCRVGFGLDTDAATLETVRGVLGPEAGVFVDANQAWSLHQAIDAIRRLQHYDVGWFEEPVAGDRISDLEALFRATGAGIASGENVYGLDGFAALVHSPAVRYLQPDVAKVGGIRQLDTICAIAASRRRAVLPHWYGGAVALAATLHVAAANPVIESVELDVRENPMRDAILRDRLRVKAGLMTVPQGPGLGIVLDDAVIEAYEEMRS
jgi:L-alanine-DL-glutamate epimerase-like enolase superfamily enzyme